MNDKKMIFLGALFGGLTVAIGAWGAHGGASLLNETTTVTFYKGVKYQMFHSLALLFTGILYLQWKEKTKLLALAGWFFSAGIILFSGSLYLIAFLSIKMGYVTPLGGISFIAGWGILSYAAVKS